MAFDLEITTSAEAELRRIRKFDRQRIVKEIYGQLVDQPDVKTRNRKPLKQNVTASFEFVPPLWELRVDEFRVFYDFRQETGKVFIRAVRHKAADQLTEEVTDA